MGVIPIINQLTKMTKNELNSYPVHGTRYDGVLNVEVKLDKFDDLFSVQTFGFDCKPDCQVGHFGYNFYFRTRKGCNRQPYKNYSELMKAIRLSALKNGYKVEYFTFGRDEVRYSEDKHFDAVETFKIV